MFLTVMSPDHDPTLRELMSEIHRVAEVMLEKFNRIEAVMTERDRRYTERDADRQLAVDRALASLKELTAQSAAASKEAIVEAKRGQDSYNVSHNDLLRKMERQAADTIQRNEADAKFRGIDEKVDAKFQAIDEKVQELKNAFSGTGGVTRGAAALKAEARANIAILITFVGMLVAIGIAMLK